MITKSDLQAVLDDMRTEDRNTRVEPPAVEEMLAYRRGELSGEEEARVRELLVCYPDLLRALMTPFPTEDAKPGDPDYLSDEKLNEQWASMQKHIQHGSGGRLLQFWPAFGAIAATIAVVFGALFWQARVELRQPRAAAWDERQVLVPDGKRGSGDPSVMLTGEGEAHFLLVSLRSQQRFDKYRLEIVAASSARPRWSSSALRPSDNDTFALFVPRAFLEPGKYQVILYGINGVREERLDTYSLRVPTTAR